MKEIFNFTRPLDTTPPVLWEVEPDKNGLGITGDGNAIYSAKNNAHEEYLDGCRTDHAPYDKADEVNDFMGYQIRTDLGNFYEFCDHFLKNPVKISDNEYAADAATFNRIKIDLPKHTVNFVPYDYIHCYLHIPDSELTEWIKDSVTEIYTYMQKNDLEVGAYLDIRHVDPYTSEGKIRFNPRLICLCTVYESSIRSGECEPFPINEDAYTIDISSGHIRFVPSFIHHTLLEDYIGEDENGDSTIDITYEEFRDYWMSDVTASTPLLDSESYITPHSRDGYVILPEQEDPGDVMSFYIPIRKHQVVLTNAMKTAITAPDHDTSAGYTIPDPNSARMYMNLCKYHDEWILNPLIIIERVNKETGDHGMCQYGPAMSEGFYFESTFVLSGSFNQYTGQFV